MEEYYNGFWLEDKEDLRKAVCIDEYLDTIHGKNEDYWRKQRWEDYDEDEFMAEKNQEREEEGWNFGYHLYASRIVKQITQQELAEEIGLSISTISRLERGLYYRGMGTRSFIRKRTKAIVEKYVEEFIEEYDLE